MVPYSEGVRVGLARTTKTFARGFSLVIQEFQYGPDQGDLESGFI